MPEFPTNPTLPLLQSYQLELCRERGWDKASDLETFLLLTEEVGELAKAIRQHKSLFVEQGKTPPVIDTPLGTMTALEAEFSDVFSYLLELANQLGVDMEMAFRKKEAKNATRVWGGNGSAV